jgi:hypothetical protein
MKKILIISQLLFLTIYISAQVYRSNTQNHKVTIVNQETKEQINAKLNEARFAAKSEELKDNYIKIKTDLLKNNSDKYQNIIITSLPGSGTTDGYGILMQIWDILKDKKNLFNTVVYKTTFANTNFGRYDPIKYDRKPTEEIKKSSKTLYLYLSQSSIQNYSRIQILTLKDINGEIIYESENKNKSLLETLFPVTTNNYIDNYTRDEAIQKVKDSKELLELGVINQSEYDEIIKKLKPFLLR